MRLSSVFSWGQTLTCTKEWAEIQSQNVVCQKMVCDHTLLGSRLYPGDMWGVESEMGVWLDGEGVGQGHRPDFQGR